MDDEMRKKAEMRNLLRPAVEQEMASAASSISPELERTNILGPQAPIDPVELQRLEKEAALKAAKAQGGSDRLLNYLQSRQENSVPLNPELTDKLRNAAEAKRLAQADDALRSKVLSGAGQAVEAPISLADSRAARKPFAKVMGAMKMGGKVASKFAPIVGPLLELANVEEANAGSDEIPGRPSFEEMYGKPEPKKFSVSNRFSGK